MPTNKQPLSPQGYNLGGEPYNHNPFWEDGEPTPPADFHGLPPGGEPGQVLTKSSYADYDADWKEPTGGGGGEGGTSDYNELSNKPSINGTQLRGDKTLEQLGIASADDMRQMDQELEGQISAEQADRQQEDAKIREELVAETLAREQADEDTADKLTTITQEQIQHANQIEQLETDVSGMFDGGAVGQVWTKTLDGQTWADPTAGNGQSNIPQRQISVYASNLIIKNISTTDGIYKSDISTSWEYNSIPVNAIITGVISNIVLVCDGLSYTAPLAYYATGGGSTTLLTSARYLNTVSGLTVVTSDGSAYYVSATCPLSLMTSRGTLSVLVKRIYGDGELNISSLRVCRHVFLLDTTEASLSREENNVINTDSEQDESPEPSD